MCGIIAVISRRNNGFFGADLELFENLLVLDTLRGLDSTGVFSVDANRNVASMKVASHPYHLFACDAWAKWRGKAINSGRILVGHNRKATKGSISSANAHPFHENNIVLVHNGSLREDHKKTMADVEVDSHALCHAFNEKGAENVIPTIDGAFALVWWDMEKSCLFAVRNDERPLSIVVTEENYILCSEAWMALQLLARDHKKVTDVIHIEPGKLYEFKIGGNFSVKDIEVKSEDWSQYTTHRQRGTLPSVLSPKSSTTVIGPPTGQTQTTTSPALTLVASSSQQQDGKGGEPNIDPILGHVNCLDYPKGEEILVKVYEMKLTPNQTAYVCRGKSLTPGRDPVDILGYLSVTGITPQIVREITENPVLGTIVKHTASTCGRSLFVNKLTPAKMVRLHNTDISEMEWNYVESVGKCKKCETRIEGWEREFTSVTRRPNNQFSVTCADCIEDKLPKDMKYEFTQNRLAALQAHEQERSEFASVVIDITPSASSPTVH